MLSTCTYTPDAVAISGQTFPARYTISPNGTVYADVTAQEGGQAVPLRIRISPDHPDHAAALAAAQPAPIEQQPAPIEQPATIEQQPDPVEKPAPVEQPDPVEQPAPIEQQPAPVEQPDPAQEQPAPDQAHSPKAARGPVPEKTFAGTEIKGRGWTIEFSTVYDRTRVIFEKVPCAAVREAVKGAGFHWSPTMKSWNKKLTFRAWRAAQALAVELNALCG